MTPDADSGTGGADGDVQKDMRQKLEEAETLIAASVCVLGHSTPPSVLLLAPINRSRKHVLCGRMPVESDAGGRRGKQNGRAAAGRRSMQRL